MIIYMYMFCRLHQKTFDKLKASDTVRAEIFAVVLFSRISRVKPSRKFPLQFMGVFIALFLSCFCVLNSVLIRD